MPVPHKSTNSPLPALANIIAAEIGAVGGQITFERYMELALYHPLHGYYAKRPQIGKEGDFLTSVSVGPLLGRILARQFLKYRRELGSPPDFKVVEFGGHAGQLRNDVLGEVPGLNYRVIEAGDELPNQITGCVFSNELLDALPVHRVRVVNGHWQELYVTVPKQSGATFKETPGPLSSPRLTDVLAGLPAHLMEGYTTEINLRAIDWMADVARRLTRGFMVTIDYGHERNEYFAPHRRDGTLLCYHRHTQNRDPFAWIGQQDITAHVEFTSLIEQGRRCGLELIQFCDQSRFLLDAGREILEAIATRDAGQWSAERNQAHQLIHPTHMGRAFKVLIQRKTHGV